MKWYTIDRQYADTDYGDETGSSFFQKMLEDKTGPFFVRRKILGRAVAQTSQRKSTWDPVFEYAGMPDASLRPKIFDSWGTMARRLQRLTVNHDQIKGGR